MRASGVLAGRASGLVYSTSAHVRRRPIDLGKVLRRASAGVFSSASGLQRCRRQVHRVFSNAETFNQGSPQIIAIATHL